MSIVCNLFTFLAGFVLVVASLTYLFAPDQTRRELRELALGCAAILLALTGLVQLAYRTDPITFLVFIVLASGTAYVIRRHRHPHKKSADERRYADRTPTLPPNGGGEE